MVVDVHDAGERCDCFAVDKCIGDGVARREAAGNRNKIDELEFYRRLRLNELENVRDRHASHGIVLDVAAGMEGGLEVDPANGGMPDRKVDDLSDFVFVDAAFDCGNERYV